MLFYHIMYAMLADNSYLLAAVLKLELLSTQVITWVDKHADLILVT